jgi:hypothetical protein
MTNKITKIIISILTVLLIILLTLKSLNMIGVAQVFYQCEVLGDFYCQDTLNYGVVFIDKSELKTNDKVFYIKGFNTGIGKYVFKL